ncbi:MAG TPA: hypothetical protein VEW08_13410 [Steroidobacteraceae bacterium]|nr:hypothetical protein [Steroidobacteraceae bacterium]
MNKFWWVSLSVALGLVAMSALGAEPVESSPGSTKEFVVAMPPDIGSARSVILVLSDVRLPRMAAVVLRARLVETKAVKGGADIVALLPLGSVGLLAESANAQGVTHHSVVRIEVTKKLKRWRQDHPGVSSLNIRVIPFAGADPLPHLEWSAASARLSLSGS